MKVDVDGNPGLAQRVRRAGHPRREGVPDGEVVDEFVGAQPAPMVERFMDRLVPSEADALVAEGDEQSLRRALELEPGRADAAVALARMLIDRGELDEAAQAARERQRATSPPRASPPLLELKLRASRRTARRGRRRAAAGDTRAGLERLIAALEQAEDDETKDQIRKAMVGVFTELGADHPLTREYRRKLAAALY